MSADTFTEPQPTPLALLLLGREADPARERGVDCPGDLPAPSDPDLVERARAAKAALGDRVFVLGHHYQRDEVIAVRRRHRRLLQARPRRRRPPRGRVHRLLRRALHGRVAPTSSPPPDQAGGPARPRRRLLDGRHGHAEQVAECWDVLTDAGVADVTVPVSYMNSSAAIKAFTGGTAAPSAPRPTPSGRWSWAFEQGEKVLFLPDQHLGRNTAVRDLGMSLEDCVLYNPHKPNGGLTAEQLRAAKMILWSGHCSVHGRFTLDSVDDVRERIPGVNVLVHPECQHEVVAAADLRRLHRVHHQDPRGRPGRHRRGRSAPSSTWSAGWPSAHPDKQIVFLDEDRLLLLDDEPHRPAAPGVDAGVAGRRAASSTASRSTPRRRRCAKLALDQMLALPGVQSAPARAQD